jgi:hypothetical protein
MVTPGAVAAPTFLGPTPYLAFDNAVPGAGTATSPFNGLTFSYFYLETFQDWVLTPGGTLNAGTYSGPGGITDSVDADDGIIDGSGVNGRSIWTYGVPGFQFTFNAAVLGSLPTHAGIVWTDGATYNDVTFEAFGPGGASLGTIFASNIGDGNFASGTAEDRFFGVIYEGGISAIAIKSPGMPGADGAGIEVDHLQYGFAAVIPEPEAYAMLLAGLALLGFMRRRRDR